MSPSQAAPTPAGSSVALVGPAPILAAIGRALRARGLCERVSAHAPNDGPELEAAVREADTILVASPPPAVPKILGRVIKLARPDALVMDTAPVKEALLDQADDLVPLTRRYVSVHPVLGLGNPERGDAGLFEDAPVVLVPSMSTRPEAIEQAQAFWESLGARVSQALPSEHDVVVACVEHLPRLLSSALAATVAGLLPELREISRLTGPDLRATTMPARRSCGRTALLFSTNAEHLRVGLAALLDRLGALDRALATAGDGGGISDLEKLLGEGMAAARDLAPPPAATNGEPSAASQD